MVKITSDNIEQKQTEQHVEKNTTEIIQNSATDSIYLFNLPVLEFLNSESVLYQEIFKRLTMLLCVQYLKEIYCGKEPFSNGVLYNTFCYLIGILVYYHIVADIIS